MKITEERANGISIYFILVFVCCTYQDWLFSSQEVLAIINKYRQEECFKIFKEAPASLFTPHVEIREKGMRQQLNSEQLESGKINSIIDLFFAAATNLIIKNEASVIGAYLMATRCTHFMIDKSGATLLHIAVRHSRLEISRMLISDWAVVNAQDANGNSPLHEASQRGLLDIIKILLSNGADVNIKNGAGIANVIVNS